MWWEVIPSACIMMVCLSLPQYTAWYWNKAFFGNGYRRKMDTIFDRSMFTRDGRLTGAAWIIKGLESIPDE